MPRSFLVKKRDKVSSTIEQEEVVVAPKRIRNQALNYTGFYHGVSRHDVGLLRDPGYGERPIIEAARKPWILMDPSSRTTIDRHSSSHRYLIVPPAGTGYLDPEPPLIRLTDPSFVRPGTPCRSTSPVVYPDPSPTSCSRLNGSSSGSNSSRSVCTSPEVVTDTDPDSVDRSESPIVDVVNDTSDEEDTLQALRDGRREREERERRSPGGEPSEAAERRPGPPEGVTAQTRGEAGRRLQGAGSPQRAPEPASPFTCRTPVSSPTQVLMEASLKFADPRFWHSSLTASRVAVQVPSFQYFPPRYYQGLRRPMEAATPPTLAPTPVTVPIPSPYPSPASSAFRPTRTLAPHHLYPSGHVHPAHGGHLLQPHPNPFLPRHARTPFLPSPLSALPPHPPAPPPRPLPHPPPRRSQVYADAVKELDLKGSRTPSSPNVVVSSPDKPTESASGQSEKSSPPAGLPWMLDSPSKEALESPSSVFSPWDADPLKKAPPRRANEPPRYQCEACKKSYATYSGLSKHKQFHCETNIKKEFVCKYCEKTYTSLGAIKMHIRTHTLPCKCQICGKAFSRPWLLQGHVRTHTGEKPFQCPHCGRSFADRSNLRAHLQTHTDVKKYNCKTCTKTFSRMSLLLKHEEGSCPGLRSSMSLAV